MRKKSRNTTPFSFRVRGNGFEHIMFESEIVGSLCRENGAWMVRTEGILGDHEFECRAKHEAREAVLKIAKECTVKKTEPTSKKWLDGYRVPRKANS